MVTPEQPADHAAIYLARAARAIADGDERRAQVQFTAAWRHAIKPVRSIAWRRLDDADLVDEAASHAGVKLWGTVKRGYTPSEGWAQILLTCAQRAALDVLTVHMRRAPERNEIDDSTTTTTIEADTSRIETLARVYTASGKLLWGRVLLATAARAVQNRAAPIEWNEIAADLGISPTDVRQAVFHMKKDADFLALFAPDADVDVEIPEQTSLFPAPSMHGAA